MRVAPGVGAVVVAFLLACGGGSSVDPEAHLNAVCADVWPVTNRHRLPEVDRAPRRPDPGPILYVDAQGFRFDWDLVDDDQLTSALSERLQSGLPTEVVWLAPSDDASPARVGAGLAAIAGAGKKAALILASNTEIQVPEAPSPAYAQEFQERLNAVSADMRQMIIAQEISGLVMLCPSGQEVFEAVANVSPDHKCQLIAAGLKEALPSCPLTNGDDVVSAMQVVLGPTLRELALTYVELEIRDDAPPLDLSGATWKEAAARVAALDGTAVSIPR
jgi:hypothetical protein